MSGVARGVDPNRFFIDIEDGQLEVKLLPSWSGRLGVHCIAIYHITHNPEARVLRYAVEFYSKNPTALFEWVVDSIVTGKQITPDHLQEFVYALGGVVVGRENLRSPTPPKGLLN